MRLAESPSRPNANGRPTGSAAWVGSGGGGNRTLVREGIRNSHYVRRLGSSRRSGQAPNRPSQTLSPVFSRLPSGRPAATSPDCLLMAAPRTGPVHQWSVKRARSSAYAAIANSVLAVESFQTV